jgi:glyoxylase I family protein
MEDVMAKIKHIALSTQDPDKTARFYIDVFGMKEIAKVDSPGASGYYLSDGDLNLAILKFKSDAVAGVERGKNWSGIHHIGFEVESLEDITAKLAAAGSKPRDDVNRALGVGHGPRQGGNVEVKYTGPDGIMVDVSETGWVGTTGNM